MAERRPFFHDLGLTLYLGDSLRVMRDLPDESVNCLVTSPPYWKMRDNGLKAQLGQENTPELYVAALTEIFAEARRILRSDGVAWINLGDKFLKKEMLGIPHLVSESLRTVGWKRRMEIIWNKTNVRPESAKDRPTLAHEYLFMLTKSPRYWYDAKAIEEPAKWERWGDQTVAKYAKTKTATGWMEPKTKTELQKRTTKNKRSVWSIPTANYPGYHDAVFPDALAEPCILAGCPEGGVLFDPFIGSGTTAVVGIGHNRTCVGIELDRAAAKQCVQRVKTEVKGVPE